VAERQPETNCKSLYEEDEILTMKRNILQRLEWRLSGPRLLVEAAKTQVQNAVADYSIALQEPSSIAFTAILVSLNRLD
jgi:hypothetical protein